MIKRWHIVVFSTLISVGAFYFVLRQANLPSVIAAFENARYGYAGLFIAVTLVIICARGLRWSILTQGHLNLIDATWLFCIGFLFNNILPARLGEVARAVLAGRKPNMHFSSAASSIIVERLFDFLSLAVLLGIVLLTLDLPAWATQAGLASAAGAVAGLGALAVAAYKPQFAINTGAAMLSLLPRISREQAAGFLSPFVEGLAAVSDWKTFGLGLAMSVIAWLGSGLSAWVLMLAFWEVVPFVDGLAAVAAAGLGIAVPAAPSGAGPFHWAVTETLSFLQYDANMAISYAFALHGVSFVVTCVLGMLGLLREGLTFEEVRAAAQNARTSAASPVEPINAQPTALE